MAITELQRAARIRGVGSSDAAAILGFSPWRNAADVRLEKLGLVEPEPAGELAEIGTALESGIAALAERRLNCRLVECPDTYAHENGVMFANLDRQVGTAERGSPIVECKDSGLDGDWGETGTDQVPPYVLIQVCHQIVCSGAELAHIARLGRGFNRGLFMHHITMTDAVKKLCGLLETRIPEWWKAHIVNRDPLPDTALPPSLDILKRVGRVPTTAVEISPELVQAWREADEASKTADKALDLAKARLIDALGTAESGKSEKGSVTYLSQTRKSYTVQESTFRVLRFKAAQ